MNAQTEIKATHKGIALALASAQTQMGKASKSSKNPHFKSKYADLSSVMDACMAPLNEAGIAVVQPTCDDEHGRYVKTVLIHGESGETLECRVPLIVGKNDMQGYGSAVTYARRYGLMSMAGIAPEDDDGNAAARAAPTVDPGPAKEKQQAPRDPWTHTIVSELPQETSPRGVAEEIAKALCDQFKRMKGDRQLRNEWDRRVHLIEGEKAFEGKHPDLHDTVIDAYETRMNELTEAKREGGE